MMCDRIWRVEGSEGPLVAVAVHDGHVARPEVDSLFALSEAGRMREEDPYTAAWTAMAGIRVVGTRTRFEVDLNRSRGEAVYESPDDAWGLQVWKSELPRDVVSRSLEEYDAFYGAMRTLFQDLVDRYGCFAVFDLHSYNHRRAGPGGDAADERGNPEVNIGTGTLDRARWAPLVDGFIRDLRDVDYLGRRLDVRENVKFVGRGFPRFVHEHFPDTGCALAIEFKKIFMDEWSGELDAAAHEAIGKALASTVAGVLRTLRDSYGCRA